MRTATKVALITIVFWSSVIGCVYMAFRPQPTPTLTATHRPDGSIESVGNTTYQHKPGDGLQTNPAPSDGLLVRKGDAFVGGTNAETAKAIIHSAFLGPAHPAEYAFLLVDQQHGGHMVIAISPDGTVKFGDGVTPNEAALQFAEAMKTVMAQRSDCAAPLPEQR